MRRVTIFEKNDNQDALTFFREHQIDYTNMIYQHLNGIHYIKYNVQLCETDLLMLKIKSPNLTIILE